MREIPNAYKEIIQKNKLCKNAHKYCVILGTARHCNLRNVKNEDSLIQVLN